MDSNRKPSYYDKEMSPRVPPGTVAVSNMYGVQENPMMGLKIPEMNENVVLEQCKYCKRKFAPNRLDTHTAICKNLQLAPKRKVFDSQRQRLSGTEAEPFARNAKTVERPVSNWRKNHEDLIEAIRAARRAHAHIARGGKPIDLPPPPPTDYSDYIQCPHCGRRFNELAAGKHIPACEKMMHNKSSTSRSKP